MNKHQIPSKPEHSHTPDPDAGQEGHGKLSIRRETVRILTDRQLGNVVGGLINTGSDTDPTVSVC